MTKILTIAKNTFIETLRQPIFSIIVAFAIILFIMSPSLAMYTMDDDVKLLRELGLSTLFLTGLFIAIFSATSAITEEIESRTITTVISKPVPRVSFVLGKFIGITAAVFIAHYICTIAMLLMVRHGVMTTASDTHDWVVITSAAIALLGTFLLSAFLNYTYDWNFCATGISCATIFSTLSIIFLAFIDKEWRFNPLNNGFTSFDIYGSVLLLMAVVILIALAVLFSTRLNVVLTLTCCIACFLLGLISDYVFGKFAETQIWAKIGKILLPNLQVFWISDAIYEGSTIEPTYIGISAIYTVLYTSGILFLATSLFQKKQVG